MAVEAGLDLRQANRALQRLAAAELAIHAPRAPGGRTRWQPTPRGRQATIAVSESPVLMSLPVAPRPGSSAHRLLRQLDRPKRLSTIAVELGLSKQRVHQIIIRLLALGLVRSADPNWPTRLVARADDPTRLLRLGEEKALSAIPEKTGTTVGHLARRARRPASALGASVDRLVTAGLVHVSGEGDRAHLRLTPVGVEHPQRDPSARRADAPALPVKSDRVRSVLDHLADNGPARTMSVGQALGIERFSMNALMQYLKRRGLVRKAGASLTAPHELTEEGRRVREEMGRRAQGSGA